MKGQNVSSGFAVSIAVSRTEKQMGATLRSDTWNSEGATHLVTLHMRGSEEALTVPERTTGREMISLPVPFLNIT